MRSAKKARPYTQVDEDAMQTYISEYSGKYDIGTLQFCKELVDAKIPEVCAGVLWYFL